MGLAGLLKTVSDVDKAVARPCALKWLRSGCASSQCRAASFFGILSVTYLLGVMMALLPGVLVMRTLLLRVLSSGELMLLDGVVKNKY